MRYMMSIKRHYAISKLQITQLATSARNFLGQNSTIVRCCSLIHAQSEIGRNKFCKLVDEKVYTIVFCTVVRRDEIRCHLNQGSALFNQDASNRPIGFKLFVSLFAAFLRPFRSLMSGRTILVHVSA